MLTPEKLEARRQGVGSSDIAAICGMVDPQNPLNRFKGPISVYEDKIGEAPPQEDNEAMWWGRALEPVLLARYEQTVCLPELTAWPWDGIARRADHPWCAASPDGFAAVLPEDPEWGVELKTAFSYSQVRRWGAGGDQVPEEYLVQCQWCMFVTGLARWDVAVLLAGYHGAEFRTYTLKADRALQDRLFEIARTFWFEHVQKRVPPPATGLAADFDAMRRLLAGSHPEPRVTLAMEDERGLLEELFNASDERKAAEQEERRLKAEIARICHAQQAEGIEAPGIGKVYARTDAKGGVRITSYPEEH